jgi:uncharacterized integral membrane protein
MKRWRWAILLLVAILAGAFAYLNGGERIALNLGFTVLFRVPLSIVVFGAFLLGMIVMFLLGLRHDLRVRRVLREIERSEPAPPPWVPDRTTDPLS